MLPSNPHTLIVDDEANIRSFLQAALLKNGHLVTQTGSGEEALALLRDTPFDLAILDLNLGGKVDGLRLLEAIRWRWPATVVVILTGRGSLETALSAIQEGVDGYLLKPVDADQIRRAVDEAMRRAVRRAATSPKPMVRTSHGELSLDQARRQVMVAGRAVELTATEYKLLAYMLADPERTFTAAELVGAIQPELPTSDEEIRKIARWYIYRLRLKIENDPKKPRWLINVRSVGYRLGG